MVLKIAVLLLLLAVVFFQSLHGFLSALIMMVLTLLCAVLALTHFELLHDMVLAAFIPEYGLAAALMALFLIPLGLLRLGMDKVIAGNPSVPQLIDRVGAPLCGVVTGFVATGMVAIAFQLLPFDTELLGFRRMVPVNVAGDPIGDDIEPIDYPLDVKYEKQNLWLNPDGVTVTLVSTMADGVFSAGGAPEDGRPNPRRFTGVHPDLLTELYWRRNGVQRESRHWVPPDALTVQRAKVIRPTERWVRHPPAQADGLVQWEPGPGPEPGSQFIAVEVVISRGAADSDNRQRFRGGQFRLVCYDAETHTQQFPLAGFCMDPRAFGDEGKYFYLDQDRPMVFDAEGEPRGLLFEVPEGLEPWFVEYKGSARAEVRRVEVPTGVASVGSTLPPTGTISIAPNPSPPGTSTAEPPPRQPPPEPQQRDRISSRYIKTGQTRFSDELPIPLTRKAAIDSHAEVSGDKLEAGHLVVELSDVQGADEITKFGVPQGMRLFQLGLEKEEAQSIFGRALQFTRQTLEQYTVIDERGDAYFRIGEIRVADVGGREFLEMQYWPEAEMPERCIRPFERVQERDLKGDFELIYLFLLPEGRKPVRFSVGGAKVRDIGDVPGG